MSLILQDADAQAPPPELRGPDHSSLVLKQWSEGKWNRADVNLSSLKGKFT